MLELARNVAGPYAGKLLADQGAEVIKLEGLGPALVAFLMFVRGWGTIYTTASSPGVLPPHHPSGGGSAGPSYTGIQPPVSIRALRRFSSLASQICVSPCSLLAKHRLHLSHLCAMTVTKLGSRIECSDA